MEGSVLKSGEQVRINAQLIEALKGNHVWSETYNRKWTDLLSILDEITLEVVRSLTVEVGLPYPDDPTKKTTTNLEAWLLGQKANNHFDRFTREDSAKTIDLLKQAIEIDPNYTTAYSFLATALMFDARYRWAASPKESMKQAKEMALKAVEIDDSEGYVHQTLGELYLNERNYDDALFEFKKAVDLDPNDYFAYVRLARCMLFSGQAQEALPVVKESVRLNPKYGWGTPAFLGRIYFHTGRHEEALTKYKEVYEMCSRGDCSMWLSHLYLAMVYSILDQGRKHVFTCKNFSKSDPGLILKPDAEQVFLKIRRILTEKLKHSAKQEHLRNRLRNDASYKCAIAQAFLQF